MIKLHLGCNNVIIPGWINIDINEHTGQGEFIQHDLSLGLPPQIEDNSVDFIYSQHFLEHITRSQATRLLIDCHKKLKPSGVIRICVPNLGSVVARYFYKDIGYGEGEGAYKPHSRCQMMNDAFKAWGHQYMYNEEELRLVLKEAGFTQIYLSNHNGSTYNELCDLESRSSEDLIIEAEKT